MRQHLTKTKFAWKLNKTLFYFTGASTRKEKRSVFPEAEMNKISV